MNTLWLDVKYGLRALLARPGFSLLVIAILALGIGASTALFSIVDGILLRPLPYHESKRLAVITVSFPDMPRAPFSWPDFQDLQQQNHVFTSIAVYNSEYRTLIGHGLPRRLIAQQVSGNYFQTLGLQALLGRTLAAGDASRRAGPVVLLSRSLWIQEFGADAHLIGRSIDLDNRSYTVIGIMPAGFALNQHADICVPLDLHTPQMDSRGNRPGLIAIARLRAGVTVEQAQQDVNAIMRRLGNEHPETDGGMGARVVDLHRFMQGNVREPLFLLSASVVLLFFITCSNLAGLLLARGLLRRQELAVRSALGASKGALIRSALVECFTLAIAGGSLGWLLASSMRGILAAALPPDFAFPDPVAVGIPVLLVSALLTLVSTLLFGLPIAIQAVSSHPAELLQSTSRTTHPGAQKLQRRFVIAEIALTMVLLAGAGVLLRSYLHLLQRPNGFNPVGVLSAQVTLPADAYPDETRRLVFFERLMQRVRGLPGIAAAGLVEPLPYDHSEWETEYAIEGQPPPSADYRRRVQMFIVTPGYFRTMHIPILQGRMLKPADEHPAPGAVVISRSFAQRWWPNENPLGRHLKLHVDHFGDQSAPPLTVVGVVGDVRISSALSLPPLEVYLPIGQRTPSDMTLAVRVHNGDPLSLVAGLQDAVRETDPSLPIYDIATMKQRVSSSIATPRLAWTVLTAFAGMGLLLAGVGLYGLLSFLVAQRRREIGIRMAIGANRRDILSMVLREGWAMIATGLLLGIVTALLVGRALAGILFGVPPWDPWVLLLAALVLFIIGMFASWLPAIRAARTDPIESLRCE